MKPIKLSGPTHTFVLEDWGHWTLTPNNARCPEEESCSGTIATQHDRVALSTFLREITDKLATPKKGR